MAYTYDPAKIGLRGKDRMRFELGDTAVGGGEDTCALCDEEYEAVLSEAPDGKRGWLNAKASILNAIVFKLSYEVDTKIDSLSYSLGSRAEHFRKLLDDVKAEMPASFGAPLMAGGASQKPPYFYTGMHKNY